MICITGLTIRFFLTPFGLPTTFDAFNGYFLYALDISILGHWPNYTLSQSGWGEFLSLFFMIFHSDQLIDYFNLQRIISVILSSMTVFPVYFICKKFFNQYYSLIGATIFAVEPRLIINSTLGISEPLYILVISLAILFFLNQNKKIIFSSFGLFALATIIRPEGQFWFFAFSIMYFLRFRKNRKDLMMYILCFTIFVLVLLPIVIHRIQCCEDDSIIGRLFLEINNYSINKDKSPELIEKTGLISYGPNFFNGIKLFGWAMFPIFMVLVPLGIISLMKKKSLERNIIVVLGIMIFPSLYSVSIAPDTRYVYPLFPIFCLISLYGIKNTGEFLHAEKKILRLVIIAIIISSLIFLNIKKIDFTEERESYEISKIMIKDVRGINDGSKIVKYFQIVEMENKWPIKETSGDYNKKYLVKIINTNNYDSLEQLLSSEKNDLTHIIVDDSKNYPKYLLDITDNEERYPFLMKVFDSNEYGFNYSIKIYKIDYNMFQKIENYG